MRYLFYLLIVVLVSSCVSNKSDDISLNDKVKAENILKDSYPRYILLKETVKIKKPISWRDSLKAINIQRYGKFILGQVWRKDAFECHLWDDSGNYLASIGSIGKGPGEYLNAGQIFFKDDSTVVIFDTGARAFNSYSLEKPTKPVFIDKTLIEDLYQTNIYEYPTRIFKTQNGYLFIHTAGFQKTPVVYRFNNDLKLLNSFHARSHTTLTRWDEVVITDDSIVIPDSRIDSEKNSSMPHVSSNVWIYSYDGILKKKINIRDKDFVTIKRDRSGKYLLVFSHSGLSVWTLSGEFIGKTPKYSTPPKKELEYLNRCIWFCESGKYGEEEVRIEIPEDKEILAVLYFTEYFLGI